MRCDKRGWFVFLVLVAAGVALAAAPVGGPKKPPEQGNAFMQLKVKSAEMVLAGIAVKDFERIETGAAALVRLSKKTEFQMGSIPGYDQHNANFRRTAEELVRHAKNKNLDGAALAYIQLTRNCVECHKELRRHTRR